MSLNPHVFFQDQIQSGRKLSPEEQSALDAHLAACSDCRSYAGFHAQLSDTLPPLYPTARHEQREIRAKAGAVQSRLQKRRRVSLFLQHSLTLSAASAAVVLLLVIFAILPRFTAPTPASPSTPALLATADTGDETPILTPPASTGVSRTAPPSPTRPAGLPRATAAVEEPVPTATAAPWLPGDPVPSVSTTGQIAFVGFGSRLNAVDFSRPDAPRSIARSQELPGEVLKVLPLPNAVTPRVVASAGRYLVVLATSDPIDLGLITQSKLPGPVNALILDLGTGRLYAGGPLYHDRTKGYVVIYDTASPDTLDLLNTLQLDAPVQGLALLRSTLFVGFNTGVARVATIPLVNDRFGAMQDLVSPGIPIYTMTVTSGNTLFLGSDRMLAAYRLTPPSKTGEPWKAEADFQAPVDGAVLGFDLRSTRAYVAGRASGGERFQQVVTLPGTIQSGSVVDGASYVSAGNGLMLVAGNPLEIYDMVDPKALKLLATYKLE